MGFFNWLIQRSMQKEAKRMAKEVSKLYPESKEKNPNASEQTVIMKMVFKDEAIARMSDKYKKRLLVCCETIQGFCYMMALDAGNLKGFINLRSLQFTHYMDRELEAVGFSKQSKEQKARILEAMELKIPNWDEISGD